MNLIRNYKNLVNNKLEEEMAKKQIKESILEKKVTEIALENNYLPFRIATRDTNGVPDMLLLDRSGNTVYLELKTWSKLRPEQRIFSRLANNYYKCVYVPQTGTIEAYTDIEDKSSAVPLGILLATLLSVNETWVEEKEAYRKQKLAQIQSYITEEDYQVVTDDYKIL